MKLIKSTLIYVGSIISFFYSLPHKNCVDMILTVLRSGYYQRFFKKFDNSSRIMDKVFTNGLNYIIVGKKCIIGRGSALTAWPVKHINNGVPEIIIGNNVQIGFYSHITAINRIVIGNNVLTGKHVLITDNAHGDSGYKNIYIPPSKRALCSKGEVIIEDNVWIGEKVSILPGVHIGYGSIIAANSVVTHDIPPFSMAAGIPAQVIKNLKINK